MIAAHAVAMMVAGTTTTDHRDRLHRQQPTHLHMALKGIKVLEIAGLAPAPFAGMLLADHGASVVRVDRCSRGRAKFSMDTLCRGKRSIALDLKAPAGRDALRRLARGADVLIEPFRPGVMERLGLGPDVLCADNPRLVYARMTGFGQGGQPATRDAAGHDINYLAVSGVLSALRKQGETPHPPVNLLGDFAGGGMLCAVGVLLALLERARSGKGQVVDAAMVDGAAYLASFLWKGTNAGLMDNSLEGVGGNLLDGGAHFYGTYACADGKHFAVGAIEPQFYAKLCAGLGLDRDELPAQLDADAWPALKRKVAAIFKTKTRDEWAAIFEGTDACAFPILDYEEAAAHPHNVARGTFLRTREGDAWEPGPAPKLSRSPGVGAAGAMPQAGEHTRAVLAEYGFSGGEVGALLDAGVAAQAGGMSRL